jgi:DNA-binding NtrC family response regulator
MTDLSHKKILIIDDDPGMLRVMEKVFRREGCDVTSATWAREGFERLAESPTPFDLVITDLRMPSASGMTILQAVRIAYPQVPVIIITAYGAADLDADWWKDQGAAAYLEKPIDAAHLMAAVKRAMDPGHLETVIS